MVTENVVCDEKAKLLELYQLAAGAYSEAVAQLHRNIGTSSKADYDALYRMTEALRRDALEAQGNLEKHVDRHHC